MTLGPTDGHLLRAMTNAVSATSQPAHSCNAHCQRILIGSVANSGALSRRAPRDAVLSDGRGRKSSVVRYRGAKRAQLLDDRRRGGSGEGEGGCQAVVLRVKRRADGRRVANDALHLRCFALALIPLSSSHPVTGHTRTPLSVSVKRSDRAALFGSIAGLIFLNAAD